MKLLKKLFNFLWPPGGYLTPDPRWTIDVPPELIPIGELQYMSLRLNSYIRHRQHQKRLHDIIVKMRNRTVKTS